MNSEPSGSPYSKISLLLGQGFVMGVVSTVLCTVANSLFLSEYGAGHLPKIYLGLALFVPVLSFLYTSTYARLSRVALAYVFAATFLGLCVGGWVLHREEQHRWFAYVLLMGWNAYSLVGLLIQGDQVQRLFDVREIKHANPTIMAGPIVGAVVGGLSVGPLISFLGSSVDLLLFCGALIPLNLALELFTIHRFPVLRKPPGRTTSARTKTAMSLGRALRTRYVLRVLFYGACYGLTIRLISYLFMSAAQRLTDTPEQLSHLLGVCLSVGTGGSFLFVLFGSSRLLHRFGPGVSLAGSPILIGPLILVAVAAVLARGNDYPPFLWLMVGAYLLSHTLDSGTTVTALRTCLQALPVAQRTAAETAASGLGKAVANGLAGGSILLLQAVHLEGVKIILLLILVTGGFWLLASRLLASDYAALLLRSIKGRALPAARIELEDPRTLEVLESCLGSDDAARMGFALDVLRDSGHPSYVPRILELARSDREDVAVAALERIEAGPIHEARELVEELMATPLGPARKAALIRCSCALLEADAIPLATSWLDDPDATVRASAYTALLRYCGIGGVFAAGERLESLRVDAEPERRAFAAEIMEGVGDPSLYQLLDPLLRDPERSVRQQALLAARTVRHARLVPSIAACLSDPELCPIAMAALNESGDCMLPFLSASLDDAGRPRQEVVRLIRASSRHGGAGLVDLLKRHMDHPVEEVRQQVLKTLANLGYIAASGEIDGIHRAIRLEVQAGLRLLRAERAFDAHSGFGSLVRALRFEGFVHRERVFLLLSFVVERHTMIRLGETLLHGSRAERAVALETLELALTSELGRMVVPLFNEAEPLSKRIEQLARSLPGPAVDQEQDPLLRIIANRDGVWSCAWTRVWAVQAAVSSWVERGGERRLAWDELQAALECCLELRDPALDAISSWALRILARHRDPGGPPGEGACPWRDGNDPMMITLEKLNILHEVDLFAETPDFALTSVAAIAEELEVAAGETFMHRGAEGDSMFIVVSGSVRIHVEDETVAVVKPFLCFGIPSALDPAPRAVSATAVEDSTLLSIGRRAFEEVIINQPEIARATLRRLAREVRLLAEGGGKITSMQG